MTTIRVEEHAKHQDGSFAARVVMDGLLFDVTIADPADAATEKELGWYFEQHLRYPFLDQDREHAAVELIQAYGQALFSQLFGNEAGHAYRKLRDAAFDDCRLEVAGSAAFHRLHWEALQDPAVDKPLALRFPITRQIDRLGSQFDLSTDRPSLNVLVVTARPSGPNDVGYRTISRPLLDAMRQATVPVRVDLVRPGTWDALQKHLRSATEVHGSGWHQVIHFDLHGAFTDLDSLEQLRAAGRVVFDPHRVPKFEDRRAFLFFETAKEAQAEAVPATAVAGLLAEHRVPVAVLNACQSAMQTASEAGLAQHLVEAGVPVAVGMAYSVTVTAAEKAMPVLYEQLGQGADPVKAMHTARRELFDHRARRAYFDQDLDLEDWMLPVLFRQREVQLKLRDMTDEEAAQYWTGQSQLPEEPTTEYGFVGRDLDIQAVERRLLIAQTRNQLLIQGMAGAGKSTFLEHLGWWWQRTGLVERVFRFSYEDRAWTASQIIREISTTLLGRVEQARLDSLPGEAQLERIAQLLNGSRHMLILDNAESITATPDAIPHAISDFERDRLKRFLSRLRGGRTLVLIGSRELEAWLAPHSFDDNIYPLPGLDPQAASILVDRILTRYHATHHLNQEGERQALAELVELLGGYPLPLTVVLSQLAVTPPSNVLAELRTGGAAADPAELIKKAIEYSHGKLDPAAQTSLLLLAPFTAVIPTGPSLAGYRDLLSKQEAVQVLGDVDLDAAVQRAIDVGLASSHPQLSNMVQVQPVLPYFLRTKLREQPILTTAVTQAHYELYTGLGDALHRLLIGHTPDQRATGQLATRVNYANLTGALNYGLRTTQSIGSVIAPLAEYLSQTSQLTVRRQLLDAAIADQPPTDPENPEQLSELAYLHHSAGTTALDQHRLDEANMHYKTTLRICELMGDRRNQAGMYHQLGRVAQEQRRFDEAERYYRQALEIELEFDDRHDAASTYHQLGWVAQEQRRFAEAERYYRQALEIKLEFDDRYGAASTYHQLGWVAQEQRRFAEAEQHYKQALEIKLEFDNRHSAATTYHQLGRVAEEQRRFDEAEQHYRQALEIKLEFDNRHSAATTYHQLGVVAAEQRRFAEAERYYERALEIKLEFDDRHGAASTYHQLGVVAAEQRRFDEAERHSRQALEIKLEFDDRHKAASTYHLLGVVAAGQRRFAEADRYYERALDIELEFDDRHSAASTYHQLGSLAEEQAQFDDATRLYRKAIDLLRDAGEIHIASACALQLGRLLDKLQRHIEGAEILISAALLWYQGTGIWTSDAAGWLKRQRRILGPDTYTALMRANVPAELFDALQNAIENTDEPDEE